MKKRFLALFLALVMCAGLLPMAALAAEKEFEVDGKGVLTKYNGKGGAVTIPSGVTSIAGYAFNQREDVTSVTIPNSVTSIKSWAFTGTGLTSITIPSSVTSIESNPFSLCLSLTAVQVDAGNQNYCSKDGVLFTKDMKTLLAYPAGKKGAYTIPESVTKIDANAFHYDVGLTSVTISKNVASLGEEDSAYSLFYFCTFLTEIQVDANNQNYASKDGVLFTKDMKTLLDYPSVKTGVCDIPDSVTSIRGHAFDSSNLLTAIQVGAANPKYASKDGVLFTKDMKTLLVYPGGKRGAYTVPDGVTTIEKDTFPSIHGLTSVVIPDSVTSIGEQAFMLCQQLTTVTISSSVTSIGHSAFALCSSLKNVCYTGTEEQWKAIKFEGDNDILTSANIVYNYKMPEQSAEVGSTTIKHSTGIEFSLSKPLLGTKSTVFGAETGDPYPTQIYVIPSGTVVTPKPVGTLSPEAGRALAAGMEYTGEMEDNIHIGYELFDLSGQGVNREINEAGIEFTPEKISGDVPYAKDGVYMVECRLWVGLGWTRIFVGFEVVEDNTPTAPDKPDSGTAYASTQNVLVDGKAVEFQAYALKDANGNDTNYVKLRDVAYTLNGTAAQFSVGWDEAAKSISVTSGAAYETNGTEMKTPYSGNRSYTVSTSPLYIDGKAADLEAILLTDDAGKGYTYFKLRDLGKALGFTVDWSAEKGIFIETK